MLFLALKLCLNVRHCHGFSHDWFRTNSDGILQREVPRYFEESSGIARMSVACPNINSWKVADLFGCTVLVCLL